MRFPEWKRDLLQAMEPLVVVNWVLVRKNKLRIMKRTWLLGIPFLLASLYSCGPFELVTEPPSEEIEKVLITIEQMKDEDTLSRLSINEKASTYLWELNDTVGVFSSDGEQMDFPIEAAAAGQSYANFDGGRWALMKGDTYSAYYPYYSHNRNIDAVPVSYLGQVFDARYQKNEWEHLRNYLFLAAAPTSNEGNSLEFNLHNMGNVMKLTLTFPAPGTYTSVTVYTDAPVIPVRKTVNLKQGALTQTPVELSDRLTIDLKNVTTTTANEEVVVYVSFPAISQGTYPIKLVAYDSQGFAYTSTITKQNGDVAYAQFSVNGYQRRFATPTLKVGFNLTIGDWGNNGEDNGGSVQ